MHEALKELCKTWPRRWGAYVSAAVWTHRTTPDACLPGKATPFLMFFGRDPRIQFDTLHPEIDGDAFHGGQHSYVADLQQSFKEILDAREALLQ